MKVDHVNYELVMPCEPCQSPTLVSNSEKTGLVQTQRSPNSNKYAIAQMGRQRSMASSCPQYVSEMYLVTSRKASSSPNRGGEGTFGSAFGSWGPSCWGTYGCSGSSRVPCLEAVLQLGAQPGIWHLALWLVVFLTFFVLLNRPIRRMARNRSTVCKIGQLSTPKGEARKKKTFW